MKTFAALAVWATMVMGAVVAEAATITKTGNVITIRGGIDSGDGAKFERIFTSNVKVVKLVSRGGLVNEANKIVRIVRRNNLVTEAIGECASACAMIWLSADKHYYNANGKIGVHLAYYQDDWAIKYHQLHGIRGYELETKRGVLVNLYNDILFLNNRQYALDYIKGLYEYGVGPDDMWWIPNNMLVKFEGNWTSKPTPKPSTTSGVPTVKDSKGWQKTMSVHRSEFKRVGNRWQVKVYFTPKKSGKYNIYLYKGSSAVRARHIQVNNNRYDSARFSSISTDIAWKDINGKRVYTMYTWEKPDYFVVRYKDGTQAYHNVTL